MTARSALPPAPPPPSRYKRDDDDRPLPTWLLDAVTVDDVRLAADALRAFSVSGVSRCDGLARLLLVIAGMPDASRHLVNASNDGRLDACAEFRALRGMDIR